MLKRKITQALLDWKATANKKSLIVKGARQVGKTYSIRNFGESSYASFIEVNFLRQPDLKKIFDGDLSGAEIRKRLTAFLPEAHIVPGDTLLFLDEIQKCPQARTALKFLVEDGQMDIIASGSLLGLSYGSDDDPDVGPVASIPVGYEESLMMYSLDFEEFLWAIGYGGDGISYLKEAYETREPVLSELNNKYQSLVREYMVVGGMPEVVEEYKNSKDFNRVHTIQMRLLSDYEDDIAQHARGVEKTKVRRCFDSIPNQLARENKKFKYSQVEKKTTAKKYGSSIQWLIDANIALSCVNIANPVLPLRFNERENEFKVYLHDTGLLMAFFGKETKLALLSGTLTRHAKGGIYENFVAETLVKRGYDLHYYRPNDEMELEFLIEKEGQVLPIEVKAGNTATKSLNRFIETYRPDIAFKIIDGNVGKTEEKLSIPHYMTMFI